MGCHLADGRERKGSVSISNPVHRWTQVLIQILSALDLSEELREQCLWAVGNIAGDCDEFRQFLISMNAVQTILLQFSVSPSISMVRNATWAISNFCRNCPPLPIVQVRLGTGMCTWPHFSYNSNYRIRVVSARNVHAPNIGGTQTSEIIKQTM
eukprot:5949818-Pyramimonas_sp.AAC.3